jgi:hypothetical protein
MTEARRLNEIWRRILNLESRWESGEIGDTAFDEERIRLIYEAHALQAAGTTLATKPPAAGSRSRGKHRRQEVRV